MRAARHLILAAVILAASIQSASAQTAAVARPQPAPTLYGTLGACNNLDPAGTCTEQSVFVELDATTGAVINVIGPVGYTVNGLAWDRTTKKLYATTAIGDPTFHGLITIDPLTGKGTPVAPGVVNFGLAGNASPIHSIAVDYFGNMVGWYDEFADPGGPPVTDTFVRINKKTGIATEFNSTGLDTFQNGVAWQQFGPLGVLWNIDTARSDTGTLTQTAYVLNPLNGKPLVSRPLKPPVMAALGDFNPVNHKYYGVQFVAFATPRPPASFVEVDPILGTVKTLGQTDGNLHVIAFVKP